MKSKSQKSHDTVSFKGLFIWLRMYCTVVQSIIYSSMPLLTILTYTGSTIHIYIFNVIQNIQCMYIRVFLHFQFTCPMYICLYYIQANTCKRTCKIVHVLIYARVFVCIYAFTYTYTFTVSEQIHIHINIHVDVRAVTDWLSVPCISHQREVRAFTDRLPVPSISHQ